MNLEWQRGDGYWWFADVPAEANDGKPMAYSIVAFETPDDCGFRVYNSEHEEIGDFSFFREALEAAQTHFDERDS